MKTDWERGKPPTFVDVSVFVNGNVREGAFDGVWFHFAYSGRPEANGICHGEAISAWKYEPNDNRTSKSLINARTQMLNISPTLLGGIATGSLSGLIGI